MSSIDPLQLKVMEAYTRDVGRTVARIDYDAMDALKINTGDTVSIAGSGKRTVAKISPLYPSDEGHNIIRIDGLTRRNAKAAIGDTVSISVVKAVQASAIELSPTEPGPQIQESYFSQALDTLVITQNDQVMLPYFGGRLTYRVIETTPQTDCCLVTTQTKVKILPFESSSVLVFRTPHDVEKLEYAIELGTTKFKPSESTIALNVEVSISWGNISNLQEISIKIRDPTPESIGIALAAMRSRAQAAFQNIKSSLMNLISVTGEKGVKMDLEEAIKQIRNAILEPDKVGDEE